MGLVFPENMGAYLSIDETSLSLGELYTIVTNKEAKGKKGSIVAILRGTHSETIIPLLKRIPEQLRELVKEVTLDLAGNMGLIVKQCFFNAKQVIDRFHVQQLASEAVQEMRIKHRWKAMDMENDAIERAKKEKRTFHSTILANGDTLKQLLARSRHLLYKSKHRWNKEQNERADILFTLYPDMQRAYELTQNLVNIYNNTPNKMFALTRLAKWYDEVEQAGFKSFNILAKTIRNNYERILNYFDNRSTNASAESFNAKIKAFRAQFRGVNNVPFFLFRLTKLFA
jgi:transposase